MTESNFVTLEEAARMLGLATGTMYQYTHRKVIPFYKPHGRKIYFKYSELMDFIENSRRSSVDEIKQKAVETILNRG